MKTFRQKTKKDEMGYYLERMDHIFFGLRPPLYGCTECNFTTKRHHEKCPRCGAEKMYNLGYTAKPPKKRASQKTWDAFFKKFIKGHRQIDLH